MRNLSILAGILTMGVSQFAIAGEISGVVYDSRGRPVEGVELIVGDQSVMSASDGSYRIAYVDEGEHSIVVGSQRVSVTVSEAGTVQQNIFLFSLASRRSISGETESSTDAASLFEEAFDLAERLQTERFAHDTIAWQWNDNEG